MLHPMLGTAALDATREFFLRFVSGRVYNALNPVPAGCVSVVTYAGQSARSRAVRT